MYIHKICKTKNYIYRNPFAGIIWRNKILKIYIHTYLGITSNEKRVILEYVETFATYFSSTSIEKKVLK